MGVPSYERLITAWNLDGDETTQAITCAAVSSITWRTIQRTFVICLVYSGSGVKVEPARGCGQRGDGEDLVGPPALVAVVGDEVGAGPVAREGGLGIVRAFFLIPRFLARRRFLHDASPGGRVRQRARTSGSRSSWPRRRLG